MMEESTTSQARTVSTRLCFFCLAAQDRTCCVDSFTWFHHLSGFYFENYDSEGDGPESLHAFIRGCQPLGKSGPKNVAVLRGQLVKTYLLLGLGEQFTNAADVLLGKKACAAMHCHDLLLDMLTVQILVPVSSSAIPVIVLTVQDCLQKKKNS